MFGVVDVEDTIVVRPDRLAIGDPSDGRALDFYAELAKAIQYKHVDRVIPNVGLVVALYAVKHVGDGNIFSFDGKNYHGDVLVTVKFAVVVFRPQAGQVLDCWVRFCDELGVHLSTGFFHNVLVPVANIPTPNVYDPAKGCHLYLFDSGEQKSIGFAYSVGRPVAVRVVDIKFVPEDPTQIPENRPAGFPAMEVVARLFEDLDTFIGFDFDVNDGEQDPGRPERVIEAEVM
mmetsp:Transcript_107463/g.246013  ORF Transcript_107463/g.246013 Transcript_107463/m.246013 type:complete len:231 (-) Transcript_107463:377-1069(-)